MGEILEGIEAMLVAAAAVAAGVAGLIAALSIFARKLGQKELERRLEEASEHVEGFGEHLEGAADDMRDRGGKS